MMNRNMLRQAQAMQKKIQEVQEEIAQATTEASAGGGAVKATVIGGTQIESIEINPEAFDHIDPDDLEMIQDMVTAATNQAIEQSQQLAAEKMQSITGGLNIPGLSF